MQAYREGYPRDISLVLNGGGRRGGKTFSTILCQIAALLDVPIVGTTRSIGWVISETFKKRAEVEEQIANNIPATWFRHWKAPEFRYEFANGGLLRNLSAQDPEDLRQGRVDLLVYNEPQQMQAKAIVNGLFGTSDKGGLTMLAANPPTMTKGEWTVDLIEAINNKEVAGGIHFNFDPKLNRRIDQVARVRVASLAKVINPDQMVADDEGLWVRIGDRAYPKWAKSMLRPMPEIGDITADVIAKKTGFKGYGYLGGVDFQGYPFNAAVLWKIFQGPNNTWLYWAVDEFLVEGAEMHLLEEIREAEYEPKDIFWIGDASAQWQNYKHEQGLRSFNEFKKDGWVIRPPREKKDAKSTHSSNPPVENRLRVMLRLMEQQRIFVDPGCAKLAESYRECPLKKDGSRVKKYGRHSHETDAGDYPLYWVDPKPVAVRKITGADAFSIPIQRRGGDYI